MFKLNLSFHVIFLLLCVCTSFISSSYFVDKEILPKWYALYALTLFGWAVFFLPYRSVEVRLDKIALGVLVASSYLLINGAFSSVYGMSLEAQYVGFLLVFLLFKLVDGGDSKWFYGSIVVVCVAQALYGILQFFHLVESASSFVVVGSFDNPAGFAASLTAGFSFGFGLFGSKKSINYMAIAAMLIIGVSIVLSQARAGMVAIFIVMTIFLYAQYGYELSVKGKKLLLGGVVLATVILFSMVYLLKKDSATGRLLIWKNTWGMIVEKPILGWGSASFQSHYMLYQADYFENHPDSRFAPLADNVSHPFNEFLLFIYQYGIVGFVLLCGLMFVIFKKPNKEDFAFQLCICSILIFACFSYPFRYPFVWLVLAFCLAKLSNNSTTIYGQYMVDFRLVHRFAIAIGVLFGFYFLIKDLRFEHSWNKIAQMSLREETKNVLPHYEKLHKQWNGNPLFLYNYGAELNHIGDSEKSLDVLDKTIQHWNDYDVQMLYADNYIQLKKWYDAESHLKLAANMCPNRFIPLFELHKIYLNTNRDEEALQMAYLVINKEIKIPSPTVHSIQRQMRKYINSHHKNDT